MNAIRFAMEWIAVSAVAGFVGQAVFPRARRPLIWLVAVAGSAAVIFGWTMHVFGSSPMR